MICAWCNSVVHVVSKGNRTRVVSQKAKRQSTSAGRQNKQTNRISCGSKAAKKEEKKTKQLTYCWGTRVPVCTYVCTAHEQGLYPMTLLEHHVVKRRRKKKNFLRSHPPTTKGTFPKPLLRSLPANPPNPPIKPPTNHIRMDNLSLQNGKLDNPLNMLRRDPCQPNPLAILFPVNDDVGRVLVPADMVDEEDLGTAVAGVGEVAPEVERAQMLFKFFAQDGG